MKFFSVEYFISLYPNVFVDMNMEKLHKQFVSYQLLVTDVVQVVHEKCGLENEDVHYIDDQCNVQIHSYTIINDLYTYDVAMYIVIQKL